MPGRQCRLGTTKNTPKNMTRTDHNLLVRAIKRFAILSGIALCLVLLAVPVAFGAAFEQVGTFAGSAGPVSEFDEEVQLGGVGGMAVNYSGAGGVDPGTVYAATVTGTAPGNVRVAMFKPVGDGLKFSLRWQVTVAEEAYERCGPDLVVPSDCTPMVEAGRGFVDIEVDQATGNVYLFNGQVISAGATQITVYSPDGSDVISRFGERAAVGKKVSESPAQIHGTLSSGAMGLKADGEVYLYDVNGGFDNFYHRLMVFKPKTPGNYEEYEYAGEVAAGFLGEGELPLNPIADSAGNIYVAGDDYVQMHEPESPGAYPAGPAAVACHYDFTKGGLTAITVNPESGEVFFFGYKNPKRVFELGPCNEATGRFEEGGKEVTAEFAVTPQRDDLWGLAFDPERELTGRAPGVLYGGAPGPVPSSGVGPGQPGQSSLGYIFAAAEENPPVVKAQSASAVTATTAQLHATIDPEGHPTTYVFQYLTATAYIEAGETFTGANEAPLGGAPLEGTSAGQEAGVTLIGLLSDTEYRYRVVAESECKPIEPGVICEGTGAAQGFRTFPAGELILPDNRVYELVSPSEKHGGQVFPADPRIDSCPGGDECKPGGTYTHFPMLSAPEGEAVVYEGSSFEPGAGAAIENAHRAVRTSTGWQSTNLTPALLQSNGGAGYKTFSSDLSTSVFEQRTPTLSSSAPPGYDNFYVQSVSDPSALGPLLSAAPPNRPAEGADSFEIAYVGASTDLSRTFFAANDALTAANPPFAPAALDGGASKDNLYEWEPASGQLRLVNVMPGNATTEPGATFGTGSAHSISADGSRAFWSDEAGQLYVREDAEVTREIPDPGEFLAAATDGSRVLLANGHLYDLEAEVTLDLTAGQGGFQGLVGQGNDLSQIYFVDTAVLDAAPNSQGDVAVVGQNNLYAWSEGTTRFVATLVAQDNGSGTNSLATSWNAFPNARTAQASPNGRYVAFLSTASLTGYDNVGPCEETGSGEILSIPCPEAFHYDSVTEELTCASCNPSGASPLGWTVLRRIAGAPPFLTQPRYLTDSGRLYFDSRDSLSPSDTNDGVEDVYQFEAEGVGSCEQAGGCTALISAGREGVDSNFLAVDASGENVFFTSRDRLVATDRDELIDLYVARENGGFPEVPQVLPPELPLQAPPFEPTPASPTLNDPGNVKPKPPKRCKKGQVKRKGKCVKKNQGKKKTKNKQSRGAAK